MRAKRIIAVLLLAGIAAPGLAQSPSAAGSSTIGKVDTVYVREARGLFFEKKLLRTAGRNELWVDVRLATSLAGDPRSELFRVPEDIAIERGDLVTTQYGDSTPLALKLLPEPNKVTQLVARHDTLMAMTFGLPNAGRMLDLFVAAKAN
jgi:hypothetical protein